MSQFDPNADGLGGMGGMDDNTSSQPDKSPGAMQANISINDLYVMNGGLNTTAAKTQRLFATKLSKTETVSRIREVHTKPETKDKLEQQGLIAFAQPSVEKTTRVKFENKRFNSLAPEISNAALILVSSILSPNDLQETKLLFSVDHDQLTEDTKDELVELLDRYFNEHYDLGSKLSDWYKECLFGAGSQPVLILPDVKFMEIKNANDNTVGNESLHSALEKIINTSVYSSHSGFGLESLTGAQTAKTKPSDFFTIANESMLSDPEKKKTFDDEYVAPLLEDVFEILGPEIDKMFLASANMPAADKEKMDASRRDFKNQVVAAVEDTTIKIITKMNDGDVFRITENPEILRFHKRFSLQRKYDLTKKLDRFFSDDEDSKIYKNDPIVAISDEYKGEGDKTKTYPTEFVLPPESTMPICIPGDKKSHIGYIVVNDQFGHPLVGTEPLLDNSVCGDGNGAIAFDALFGSRNMRSFSNITQASKAAVTSKIFEHMLEKFLKAKINDIGIGDMDVTTFNNIIQVMFRRLMYHKQTVLVFVPETFVVYNAFDFREDGCGKSKLEDAAFILHLRTTYLLAKILAMQKNAINQNTVSFNVSDKMANPEQIIEQIRNSFNAKNIMAFNANPNDIVRTMTDQSLKIVSKNGYPGLEDFNIEDSTSTNRVEAPDDNLLDTLNTLWIDFLDVPHNALNQMGENEYSRSIVSSHLFFAKKIINYQKIANKLNTKYARIYTKYAKPLRVAIGNIINKRGNDSDIVQTATGTDAGKISIDDIIDSIMVELPTPKIAPDKAQFTEIKEYMDSIGELIDRLLPSEVIPSSDSETKEALEILRAFYKSKLTEEFAKIVGIDNIFELPHFDEMIEAQVGLKDVYQYAKNLRQMLASSKTALDATVNNEDAYAGTSNGMGMDGGLGGDMGMGDMGMGGDMGLDNMGDMGGDMSMPEMESEPTAPGANEPTIPDNNDELPSSSDNSKGLFNF